MPKRVEKVIKFREPKLENYVQMELERTTVEKKLVSTRGLSDLNEGEAMDYAKLLHDTFLEKWRKANEKALQNTG